MNTRWFEMSYRKFAPMSQKERMKYEAEDYDIYDDIEYDDDLEEDNEEE